MLAVQVFHGFLCITRLSNVFRVAVTSWNDTTEESQTSFHLLPLFICHRHCRCTVGALVFVCFVSFCHQSLVSNNRKKVVHTHLTLSHKTLTQAGEGEIGERKGGITEKHCRNIWHWGRTGKGPLQRWNAKIIFFSLYSCTTLARSPEHLLQL